MSEVELTKGEAERQGQEYSRKVLEEYDTFWGDAHWDYVRRFRVRWTLSKIAALEPGKSGMAVLEAGCGIGFTAFETAASDMVASVKAIDMAVEALKIAERLKSEKKFPGSAKIDFVKANYFELEESGHYDCVYMHEVFEHVQSGDAVFDKASELLKPGGYFMISTPNYSRMLNRLMKAAGKSPVLMDPYHIKEYTLDEMKASRPGWNVVAATGRQIVDETVLTVALALGRKSLYAKVAPLARKICRSGLMYHAGAVLPRVSSDLLVLYKKD